MIRLDPRAGSGELAPLFRPYGVTVRVEHLDFGDMDWLGWGPKGESAVVVERKRIDDLVQSMTSGRLSGHQLPGMARNYDYAYLVVEGIWRPGADSELTIWEGKGEAGRWVSRAIHCRAVHNYLMGLSLRAGMVVWRTASDRETVSFVVDQYRMWTEKKWGEHTCHDQVYAPADNSNGAGRRLQLVVREVGLAERVAMQLPGIDRKARAVAKRFGTVERLVGASVESWAGVPWVDKGGKKRKLGKVTAEKIWRELRA